MKNNMPILKLSVFCMLLIGQSLDAQIRESSVQTDSGSSDIKNDSPHSLFAGGGYGSNMIYLGSTISQDQPYGYASFSYGFKGELYSSLSAVHLSGKNPFAAFYIGSLTYSHTFNSWFDISAGLYRYMVVRSLTDTLFNNFTYSELSLGFDWKLLYTRISAGGLFSEDNQAYFQMRNSRYFQTPDFAGGKANVSFDPYINLLFGTITTVRRDGETSYYFSVSSHSRKWKQSGQGQQITYSDKFGILEIDFGLPVTLNADRFSFEAEPSYVVTLFDDSYYPGTKGFNFTFSVLIRIL
jgi:hypothetical protein